VCVCVCVCAEQLKNFWKDLGESFEVAVYRTGAVLLLFSTPTDGDGLLRLIFGPYVCFGGGLAQK